MLYFAYGSNMDPVQMSERCPGALPIGAARLSGYRLTFVWDSPGWGGGVGHVEPDPGDEVWGVLWDLTPAHEASLDAYEGVAQGVYVKDTLPVERAGRATEALVYRATDGRPKPPSGRYVAALVRGARAHDLPETYVARLVALGA